MPDLPTLAELQAQFVATSAITEKLSQIFNSPKFEAVIMITGTERNTGRTFQHAITANNSNTDFLNFIGCYGTLLAAKKIELTDAIHKPNIGL